MTAVSRLALSNFRNYADAVVEPGEGFVLLSGDNGAGKTNILESVSLLAPGRGLRGAALSEMARQSGPGGFAVAARTADADIGTGTEPDAPERRKVRINRASASVLLMVAAGSRLVSVSLMPFNDKHFGTTR